VRRLSQADILEAVNLLLRRRGEIPAEKFGSLQWKFGIVGNPVMTVVGEPPPDVGQIFLDWDFEPVENVVGINEAKKRKGDDS